jgi:uncharacterized membrane protein
MSTQRRIAWSLFILGIAGSLFSGYLSGVKFFTKNCAFNESCPYFIGYPACYFGFAMFATIMVFAGFHVFHVMNGKKANEVVFVISLLGILFAGYFTVIELSTLLSDGISAYILGLPTCALGLIVYCAVFVLARRLRRDFLRE